MRRPFRIGALAILIVVGLGLIWFRLSADQAAADAGTPMDIDAAGDGRLYASTAEGQLLQLSVTGDAVSTRVLAEGLSGPRGIAVIGDQLYVAELGDLPCEPGTLRCKGENIGPTAAEGEATILASSNGRVVAYTIAGEELRDRRVLVDGLRFVNGDHGLNDLDVGPDGALYLSVGNLDRLAWDDRASVPDVTGIDRIGSVLRIDAETGDVTRFASGLRNVFGLDFDANGALWGVDNDGQGRGPWRFEELLQIRDGLDYGFPDDGTVGPYSRRTGFASWIMPVGAGSSGLLVEGDTVISGGCGRITRVTLTTPDGDAIVQEANHPGCVTAIDRLPDGRLLLATVLGGEAFSVTTDDALFGG